MLGALNWALRAEVSSWLANMITRGQCQEITSHIERPYRCLHVTDLSRTGRKSDGPTGFDHMGWLRRRREADTLPDSLAIYPLLFDLPWKVLEFNIQ